MDRAALDACLLYNFQCGGWCPKGRKAEDGIIQDRYPLVETDEISYETRTKMNVLDSCGTLIISPDKPEGGTLLTFQIAKILKKPYLIIHPDSDQLSLQVNTIVSWMKVNSIKTLNVAGPRSSEWDEGYSLSIQIISAIIYEIEKSNC